MGTRQEKSDRYMVKFYNNEFKLSKNHFEDLKRFDAENQANDLSVITRQNYQEILVPFSKFIKDIDFKEVKKENIQNFLNSLNGRFSSKTLKHIKIGLRKFFSFIYGFKKGKYPDVVDWLELKDRVRNKKLEKNILNDDDVAQLLKACTCLRDRALISFLYNSGARIGEVLNVKIEDLKFDSKGRYFSVKLSGKTGEREIILVHGMSEIINYLKQHPHSNDKSKNIFYTIRGDNPLGFDGALRVIKEIGFDVLKKEISPHSFRHSCATKKAITGWNESQMRIYFGWTSGSEMPSTYTHLKDRDINKKILIEAGLEKDKDKTKEEALKDIICPRCGISNSFDSKICSNCFFMLDQIELEKIKREEEQKDRELKILRINQNRMMKMLKPYFDKQAQDFKELEEEEAEKEYEARGNEEEPEEGEDERKN